MKLSNLTTILTLCSCVASASAATFQSPPPEIVSAWKANTENIVVVFTYDGTYYLIDDTADKGMERGSYTWDKETLAFSANAIVDTNGEGGLSHPNGATSVSISGNTLNYSVAGEGTFTLTRIVNTASAIVGTWAIPGEKFSVTFLGDAAKTYYLSEETNDVPFGYTGMERGTYTWNSTTKAFSATAPTDTNGDVGINGITLASGVTINITGNSLTFFDGEETTILQRITTNPTPIRLPDFGTTRFANYRQSSSANPVLRTVGDLSPYSADAFVDSEVGATAPTVKIGSGTLITIDSDDDGGFDIEEEFPTLAALNSFLPASTAIQFKSGTATANLTTGAALTFPTTPKLIVREGDAWIAGVYRFGEDEVLQWTLPAGFVASQYVIELEIYDPVADTDVVEALLQGEVTHFDLAGKLEPGRQYEAEIAFYRIDGSTTTGSGVFSGKQGHILSAASTILNLQSLPAPASPEFFEQPVSQTGTPGSPLQLLVGINEEAFRTATFQWSKNGVEIEGQTANSLLIPSFNLANDTGRYSVTATNSQGTATSNLANVGIVGTESMAVQNLNAYKSKISTQTTASLLTPSGAEFDARIEGVGITSTFPSSAPTLTKPDNSTLALFFDDDHWDANQNDFASFASLQTAFPDGTYKINIGPTAISINLSATNYPNQPLITPSTGTWVNGKLQITASQAAAGFTLTSNATTGNGFANLYVIDTLTDTDIVSAQANTHSGDTKFVVATVNPSQLTVGKTYEVETEFDEVIHTSDITNNSWTSPPPATTYAYGVLNTTTRFTIEVVADPTSTPYTTWQSGFFNSTQLANPAISGDDVDFDNDGIDNLLEFVLGGSPIAPNPGLLKNATAPATMAGRNLIFTYDRKTTASAITQVIETSSTLTGVWTPAVHGTNNVTITTAPTADPTVERVTATIPTTAPKLFVRLRVNR